MDISDLLVFKTVVEQNGVSRAAEVLHRVPSNVTARLKKLEAELNTDLFLRESNRLTVTSAGLRLLEYTDKILNLQILECSMNVNSRWFSIIHGNCYCFFLF